jgi:2-keto-3-deoxy-L-rhamnonate aldolase RhmA
MKPRGKRRPGGHCTRWLENFQYATVKSVIEDDLIILPQIETRRGLDNVNAIADHPLTTAMAIGAYDLSADLGVCWKPDDPVVKNAIERVRGAANSAGKNMWMIGDPTALIRQGYNFLCVGETTSLLEAKLKDAVQICSSACAPVLK